MIKNLSVLTIFFVSFSHKWTSKLYKHSNETLQRLQPKENSPQDRMALKDSQEYVIVPSQRYSKTWPRHFSRF